jgi:uncharacterized protein (DUF779 family)
MVDKVVATPAALAFIETLKAKHGPNMIFHQSGGCCDNSAANLYMEGEVMVFNDVKLGELGGIPFYISALKAAMVAPSVSRRRRERPSWPVRDCSPTPNGPNW